MTEPENFEDDLFTDLYDDNEAPKTLPEPTGGQPADNVDAETQQAAVVEGEATRPPEAEQIKHEADEDQDDDEVDFNLGGRGSNAAPAVQHHDAPSTPPYGTVHRASAKEDG